jgi:glycosyltransferase involved in cell wall biosynthesis
MKVLFVFLQIDVGERHQLLGLAGQGVRPVIVCRPDAAHQDELRAAGLPIHHIEFHHRHDRAAVKALRELTKREKPDLVHVFTKIALSNTLRAIRDLPPKLVAYRGIVGNLHWLDPSARRSFLNPRVDRIICVCEAIRQDLEDNRFLGWRIPPEKLVTVYKGHYADWYRRADVPADLAELDVPAGAPVIGCVAQMRRRKGIPVLVDAFEQLPESLGAHLVLIGRVGDRLVPGRIARSPARERIRLVGWHPGAARLAGAFDIFVLPSLRREGLPRAVIEAMCQNVPPVVTDSGGSPELIEDGVSGRIVPSGNATALAAVLGILLGDPALRERLGAAAERRIREHFTPERTVRETLAVYESLVGPVSAFGLRASGAD